MAHTAACTTRRWVILSIMEIGLQGVEGVTHGGYFRSYNKEERNP